MASAMGRYPTGSGRIDESSNHSPGAERRQANTPWWVLVTKGNMRLLKSNSELTLSMSRLFLALFLLVFGLNLLFGLSIPIWVTGLLALTAGVMLLLEHFNIRVDKK